MKVTAETLTDEQIVYWWNSLSSDRTHDDAIAACHARGITAGVKREKPRGTEQFEARVRIAAAINACAVEGESP